MTAAFCWECGGALAPGKGVVAPCRDGAEHRVHKSCARRQRNITASPRVVHESYCNQRIYDGSCACGAQREH